MNIPSIDIATTPFTRAGSFLTLSRRGERVVLRSCSSRALSTKELPFWAHDFFEIALMRDGNEIQAAPVARPDCLELHGEDGRAMARFAFSDQDTLVFEAEGAEIHLLPCKPFATATAFGDDRIQLYDHPARGYHHIRAGSGCRLSMEPCRTVDGLEKLYEDRPWRVEFHANPRVHGALRFSRPLGQWQEPVPGVSECAEATRAALADWMSKMPPVEDRYKAEAEKAWLLPWINLVPVEGNLTRRTIYCSKFWMNSTWSWDNCFHALQVAPGDPDLAWEQIALFCDHQTPYGQMPDAINDLESRVGFLKPPIFGWTAMRLIARLGVERCENWIRELYEPIGAQTRWWFEHRDHDGNGFPEYHHGNDSGWDNATLFDQGYPTEGADLMAHLILQAEALSVMADHLGKSQESKSWRDFSSTLLKRLVTRRVRGGRFYSPLRGSEEAAPCLSLLNLIPLELGPRLPEKLRWSLIADVSPGGAFLTRFGLATESPQSPKYTPDGYWRGPIWAPSTYLIFVGLLDAGEIVLARTIARRFCDLCLHSPGFWENYDALSGAGLRCPSYSWTASVFTLLTAWLAENPGEILPE